MANIAIAQAARRDTHLARLVNTSRYGILTWEEFTRRAVSDGAKPEIVEFDDYKLHTKLEHEYECMNRGFNVPWGNACHPTTIKAQALKDRLKGRITSPEFMLRHSDGTGTVVSKTVYDFACSL